MEHQEMRERIHAERQAAFALFFMVMGQCLKDEFGRRGEMAIRRWIRAWATWRGQEMRQAHAAMGLPINMETLNLHWDSSSVSWVIKDEVQRGLLTQYDVAYRDAECGAANLWRAEGCWELGRLYCDENHQHIAQSYHPNGVVVIPRNMMKGDDHCFFHWMMQPAAPEVEAQLAEVTELGRELALNHQRPADPYEEWKLAIKLPCRLVGRFITILAREARQSFGQDGEAWFRASLRRYAQDRGERQLLKHLQKGLEPSPANLIEENDVPYGFVWDLREREVSSTCFAADVHYCPYNEVWADYREEELGSIYCEEVYPALARGYSAQMHCSVPQMLSKGDPVCSLRLQLDGHEVNIRS